MQPEKMAVLCCSDIAGKVRGKGFPEQDFDKRAIRGIGWTPTNVQITCFDVIAESPFGALGDLLLIPDRDTHVDVSFGTEARGPNIVIGDIVHTDGRVWECCTRSILKAALARLHNVTGLNLLSAFEHEFHFKDAGLPLGNAYTLSGFEHRRAFAERLTQAIRSADLKPDTFMKEYGVEQYEATIGPSLGVRSADDALILKELVRATAINLGEQASFTPMRDFQGVGNGVHIHMSFRDDDNNAATYDPNATHNLTKTAGSFVAGILKYLDAIVAFTAPSVISYNRLVPHRWSAAFNNLGFRDREASVRICPVSEGSDIQKADQFNFEFRASDAAASPYLQLAAIVHAGVQGIEEKLATPAATEEDLSILSADQLAAKGYIHLPRSLEEALERFNACQTALDWFPKGFPEVYNLHKQCEIDFVKGKTDEEICAAYEQTY